MIKRFFIGFVCLLLVCFIAFETVSDTSVYSLLSNIASNKVNQNEKIIIIDAGHGGLTNTID